jgi:hypothetical protein
MLLLRRVGEGAWHTPKVNAYPSEEALESLLAASPDLLPGASSEPLVVARQVQTGAGPADLIGVGLDGSILLVECKLRANSEIRRAVVGQLFAYASALWRMPAAEFERAVAARLGQPLTLAARALGSEEEWDEAAFMANLARTLQDGRFRLVTAVDTITDELKQTIEYLNDHTIAEVEVVALEIGYLSDDGVEIVLPKTYGIESLRAKAAGKGPIGEAELFDALASSCSQEGVAAFRELFEWVEPHGGSFAWGLGIAYPSTTAWFTVEGQWVAVWSCYARSTNATWDVNFEYLRRKGVSIDRLVKLADSLRQLEGVAPRFEGLEERDYLRRPSLGIDAVLAKPGVTAHVLASLNALIGEAS